MSISSDFLLRQTA